ncbi:MAG: hypothetical protein ACREN5_05475, partial [Gemmatimonadales bacterium]
MAQDDHGLAPPLGRKTVQAIGLSELEWRMVWLNNGNTVALRTRVMDPLSAATTYVEDSLRCVAGGQSTVQRCAFDAAQNQVVYEGDIGADPGALTEAQAPNAVVITFRAVLSPGTTQVDNQALAQWEALETGTLDDPGAPRQGPARSGAAFGSHDPTSLTLPGLACLFQQRLVAPVSLPRAPDADTSGGDGGSGPDSAVDSGVDRQQRLAVGARATAPEDDGAFTLRTPVDGAVVAGTAVALAALPGPVPGTVVSRTTEVIIANSTPRETVDIVEDPRSKTEQLPAHTAHTIVTAAGVIVELSTSALATDDRLHLAVVEPPAAPAPLPGEVSSLLVAVTRTSGQTAFS